MHIKKIVGFADDTSFIVANDASIIECFSIIRKFELATGITLNKQKTKLFGIGTWKGRQLWPVMGFKVVCDVIKILGIYYSNEYEQAVLISWSKILDAIRIKINLLTLRRLNIYQKAIMIKCMILFKVGIHAIRILYLRIMQKRLKR